jgi:hypothetical protein
VTHAGAYGSSLGADNSQASSISRRAAKIGIMRMNMMAVGSYKKRKIASRSAPRCHLAGLTVEKWVPKAI